VPHYDSEETQNAAVSFPDEGGQRVLASGKELFSKVGMVAVKGRSNIESEYSPMKTRDSFDVVTFKLSNTIQMTPRDLEVFAG
jgi:hypothetical protein